MSVDKLKRVIWRLEEKSGYQRGQVITMSELRSAIMFECGTYKTTIQDNIKTLIELGWLKRESRHVFIVKDEPVI